VKALLINGSPRLNSNSQQLLKELGKDLGNIYDWEIVNLRDLKISHCTGCLNCKKTGKCIFNDGFDNILLKISQSDLIIFASPIYFNSVSSLSKMFIDRFNSEYINRFVLKNKEKREKKKGIFILNGGSKEKKDEFSCIINIFDLFFKSNGIHEYKGIIIENTDNESCIQNFEDKFKPILAFLKEE
jgi:multimeric flavodoxin WrbA